MTRLYGIEFIHGVSSTEKDAFDIAFLHEYFGNSIGVVYFTLVCFYFFICLEIGTSG